MQSALNDSVLEKVVLAVEQTAHVEAPGISAAARLAEDLAIGWFGRLKLAIYLEEAFDIELPDEAVERFVTVADIVSYFSRRYFRDVAVPAVAFAA